MQLATYESGAEKTTNITHEGKVQITTELLRLYPNYLRVASIPLEIMFDLNIDAVTKELSQEK
jgi:hypothetical protein